MAFVKRKIKLKFQLGQGDFGDGGSDTFEVEGLRCSADIAKSGAVMAECNLRVFGMPLDVMNKLTILGSPLINGRNNILTVEAGSDSGGLAVVFEGIIQEAWVDARNMPQVSFIVMARTGLIGALKPVAPTSYKGTIDVGLAMSSLATQLGLSFENSGVQGVISDPYLHGCLNDQVRDLAAHIPCNWVIDGSTLAIWPLDGARAGEDILVAPDTGMIGYPLRTQNGVSVQTLFNPSIDIGKTIRIESAITPANGRWTLYDLAHNLEAETPGGRWMTTANCNLIGAQNG